MTEGWSELSRGLAAARRALRKALVVDVAPLPDEHRELLADSVDRVRGALVDLERRHRLSGG